MVGHDDPCQGVRQPLVLSDPKLPDHQAPEVKVAEQANAFMGIGGNQVDAIRFADSADAQAM